MTVRELIEELEKLDGSLRVMTRIHTGFEDVTEVQGPRMCCLNANGTHSIAPHSRTGGCWQGDGCDHEKAMGVLL